MSPELSGSLSVLAGEIAILLTDRNSGSIDGTGLNLSLETNPG